MIKNKTAQLIFQTVYCTLGIVGVLASLGLFAAKFNTDFYAYYTNLSNYICIGLMFASLVATAKSVNKKEDGFCKTAPTFKFMCVILILVTFFVYNILLAKDNSVVEYFTSLNNLLMHLILPLMFVLDWILFYEHGKVKWFWPLLCVIMPLVYVVFILIRASVLKGTDAMIYPYFFLNVDNLGWGGFFMWVSILVVLFVALGYVLFLLDNIPNFQKRRKNQLQQPKQD